MGINNPPDGGIAREVRSSIQHKWSNGRKHQITNPMPKMVWNINLMGDMTWIINPTIDKQWIIDFNGGKETFRTIVMTVEKPQIIDPKQTWTRPCHQFNSMCIWLQTPWNFIARKSPILGICGFDRLLLVILYPILTFSLNWNISFDCITSIHT